MPVNKMPGYSQTHGKQTDIRMYTHSSMAAKYVKREIEDAR